MSDDDNVLIWRRLTGSLPYICQALDQMTIHIHDLLCQPHAYLISYGTLYDCEVVRVPKQS